MQKLELFDRPLKLLEDSLQEIPSTLASDFNLFNPGYDQDLDQALEYVRGGQEKIESYQEKLKEKTGINVKLKLIKPTVY